MMGHKICFYREMWLIIPKLSPLPLLIWSTMPVLKYTVDFQLANNACEKTCINKVYQVNPQHWSIIISILIPHFHDVE